MHAKRTRLLAFTGFQNRVHLAIYGLHMAPVTKIPGWAKGVTK